MTIRAIVNCRDGSYPGKFSGHDLKYSWKYKIKIG